MPESKIIIRHVGTNAVRTVNSGDTGLYRAANLPPGVYEVTVEKDGFQAVRISSLELTVGQMLTVDAVLQLSAVSTTVEVSGQQIAPVDLESAQLSNIVDQRRITELPLLTRDPYELVALSPGVVQANSSLGGFAVNGSSERRNNFLLDGTDNNDTSVPGIPGGAVGINPDSTQEFRVITNAFQAEYGRNTGAIIDVVTKGGTNDIRGTAYWFGRYDATAARDFFNPDEEAEPFVRNQFGFSVGGPAIKDKTFWFGNYEGQRFRTTRIQQTIVPTPAFKSGVFTFSGTPVDLTNPANAQNIFGLAADPTIAQILALYPDPNGAAIDELTGIFNFPSSSAFDSDSFTVKVDHQINANHTLTNRYTFNQGSNPNAFLAEVLPGIGGIATDSRGQSYSLGLTSIFGTSFVNDFRFGWNRIRAGFDCTGVDTIDSFTPTPDQFGRGRDFNFGPIGAFGCATLGNSNGQARFTGTWSYRDTLTWTRGKHTFKFGGEMRFVGENGFNDFGTREALNFSNLFQLGVPVIDLNASTFCDINDPMFPNLPGCELGTNRFQELASIFLGQVALQTSSQFFDRQGNLQADDVRGFRQREFALLAQDTWKLTPTFTLTLGLRYEYYGTPFEVNDNFSNFFGNPAGLAPFTFDIVGPGQSRLFYRNDFNNFQPRIGISWDPFGKGKTTVRASYGIFHDRLFGNVFGNASANPPFTLAPTIAAFAPLAGLPFIPTGTPTAMVADGDFLTPVLFENNIRNPYSQNWNFGIQHEVLPSLLVELNYVGTKGTHLLRVYDGNPPQQNLIDALIAGGTPASAIQGATARLIATNNTAFFSPFVISTQATSTYNALQLNVTKRFTNGFQIQGAYTWSHAIDWASDPLAPTAANRQLPRNSRDIKNSELGNADFDVRQRLVVNYLYELPWGRGRRWLAAGILGRVLEGWQVSGISTFSDGTPYDIFCTRDSAHAGLGQRCDILSTPNPANAVPGFDPRTQTGPLREFFDEPQQFGRVGTLRRNTFTQPGIANWDILISKHTSLTERMKLEFRTEIFNAFNRVQFGTPGQLFANAGTFGQSTNQVGRPDGTSGARQFQFALKLHF